MRKILFAILLAAMLFTWPASVSAQSAIEIEQVSVQFWPEYDQPNMLVIINMVLSENLDYPVAIKLPLPAGVETPFVVASGDETNGVGDSTPYTVAAGTEHNVISYMAQGPIVHYEYYDNSLSFNGEARTFSFELAFDYPIGGVDYEVQVPVDAGQMVLVPALSDEIGKSDGLNYYRGDVAIDLNAGEVLILDIAYQKTTNILTQAAIAVSQSLGIQPEEPVSDTSFSDFFSNLKISPWSLVLVAGGLVVLGIGYYNYLQVQQDRKNSRKRGGKRRRAAAPAKAKSEIFCHNCGESAYKGDKFCRECGTKLRS